MIEATGTVLETLRQAQIDVALRDVGAGTLPVALPADEQAVLHTLRLAGAGGWRVVPTGLGNKLAAYRPEVATGEIDLLLSTQRLDQVVAYVPGDGTLTAQAGCSMETLAQHVAEHGHRLTPDVPHPARASLGGTLGAGISGPDRLLFGPARHHVLGMRIALADGTLARSGGRLVKNVTGFDLHRLYCGSRGTLGVILEASLRLFPAPETERAWCLESASPGASLAAAQTIARLPLRPQAVTLSGSPARDDWSLEVFAGGHPRQLEAEDRLVRAALGTQGVRELAEEEAREQRRRARDRHGPAGPALALSCLPSHLPEVFETLCGALDGPFEFVAQPLVASVEVYTTDAAPDPSRLPSLLKGEALVSLAAKLRALGADLEARDLPYEGHAALAAREADHPQLDWMFRLRTAFDPEGRFASPCFPGVERP